MCWIDHYEITDNKFVIVSEWYALILMFSCNTMYRDKMTYNASVCWFDHYWFDHYGKTI